MITHVMFNKPTPSLAFQIITARTAPNRNDVCDLQGPCNIRNHN